MEPSPLPDEGSKETEKKKVEEEKDPLEQQFKNLEQEWSLFKQSNPRSTTTDVSRCSSDEHSSSTTTTTIVNEDYFQQVLLNKSPRDLMSSLQRNDQKQNDWAVAEILTERWDAIESGRLKGRRLFEEEESGSGGESEMCWDHDRTDEDICSECFNLVHGSENASAVSYGSDDDHDEYNHGGKYCQAGLGLDCSYCCSLSGSSWSEEEKAEESRVIEETEEAEMQVEAEGGVCGGGGITVGYAGYWKIWMRFVAWFGVPLVMLVLGIISRKCTGEYVDQGEVSDLVPT